jgi:ubiquinone/menaquinone biosynthesis C-methylase UbiE
MTGTFYNQAYYQSHYGRFLSDAPYHRLKGLFWRKAICSLWPLPENCLMLDYGCGLGQVSAAFKECHCYDVAEFSRRFLSDSGRVVYSSTQEIPEEQFDTVLSSHSLEHSPRPFEDLRQFARFAKKDGCLILILPIERDFQRRLAVDDDNHLFAWSFQTIGNLLHASGWTPLAQELIYDSFGLKQLARIVSEKRAVQYAWRLGQARKAFGSMFIASRKSA